jgi:hypothetical protein
MPVPLHAAQAASARLTSTDGTTPEKPERTCHYSTAVSAQIAVSLYAEHVLLQ